MEDTHCSHKSLVGFCEPQKEARNNMPLTGAAREDLLFNSPLITEESVRNATDTGSSSVKICHSRAENRGKYLFSACRMHLYPLTFHRNSVCVTDWKLLGVYGKIQRSVASETHIKYMYVGTLSWSFLLQEKKLKYSNMILPWKGKIKNIWGKILK